MSKQNPNQPNSDRAQDNNEAARHQEKGAQPRADGGKKEEDKKAQQAEADPRRKDGSTDGPAG